MPPHLVAWNPWDATGPGLWFCAYQLFDHDKLLESFTDRRDQLTPGAPLIGERLG